MRISTIDIGTNTMLLLIADYDKMTSTILTLKDTVQIPRLGRGVDSNKQISRESIDKTINILNEYKKICSEFNVQEIVPFATSFLRDAKNKYEFIEKVKKGTGLDIEILSGENEARWIFWGGVYELIQDDNPDENVPKKTKHPVITIDIGGGSTEVTGSDELPDNFNRETLFRQNIYGKSIDIGSVRIKERFFKSESVSDEDIKNAETFINHSFNDFDLNLNHAELVGVAGTITTLACVSKGLNIFNSELIDGLILTKAEINEIFKNLCSLDTFKILKLGDFMKGREDIIVPGTLILKTFMTKFGFEKIRVSTKGLRYGIFLREAAV
jgi:exopolyphosphatase/guanosine-5'-triphosphate,3'-diphosphate pyrophosphatase